MEHAPKPTSYYVKIYVTLVASVAAVIAIGPMIGNWAIIMTIALCIAVFKASYFLHLNTEKKWIWLYLITALLCLFAFFFGSARAILMHEGQSWTRCNAINEANREYIAHGIAHAAEKHPHFADMQLPPGEDCVPQRF